MAEISQVDSWFNFPLLVHIQTINSKELRRVELVNENESSPLSVKTDQVTCLEGSNHFIFVGYSSGLVEVFLRSNSNLLSIITSQGCKTCSSILCSENENYVAIASNHGKLFIHRCYVERLENNLHNDSSSRSIDKNESSIFKLLYPVTHHLGNEITSLFWSSNERFLFIGDSIGVVSQLNTESLEQFPRPFPVKSVMETSSRIMHMDYVFPFLAIATVYAVYHCDIENAEFVRIQLKKDRDIRCTGLCFKLVRDDRNCNAQGNVSLCLRLLICEQGSIYSASMEGVIIDVIKITSFDNTTMQSAKLFCPIPEKYENVLPQELVQITEEERSNITLGNLLVSDTNYIISYSQDSIYIIEPDRMQIIAWILNFKKIHKLKLVSNYLFIWHSKSISLLSLTQFRVYGEQLFKTGLEKILERWIDHTLYSIGWRPPESLSTNNSELTGSLEDHLTGELHHNDTNSNLIAQNMFKSLLGSWTEDDKFISFVYHHIPNGILEIQPVALTCNPKSTPSAFTIFITMELNPILEEFSTVSDELEKQDQDANILNFHKLFECVWKFYSDNNINFPEESNVKSKISKLPKLLQSANQFLLSANKLTDEEGTNNSCKELMNKFFLNNLWKLPTTSNSLYSSFYHYAQRPDILEWFTRFGVSEQAILEDAFRADLFINLAPFSSLTTLEFSQTIKNMQFFTWITFSIFSNTPQNCRFTGVLKSLLLHSNTKKMNISKISSQILTFIYTELLNSDTSNISEILHHLISAIHFINKENIIQPKKTLKKLLASLPLQHWSKNEISVKLKQLCFTNINIIPMLTEACLTDGNSIDLCHCGIPAAYGKACFISRSTSQQFALDECLYDIILSQQIQYNLKESFKTSVAIQFGMKRSLAKHLIMSTPYKYIDEDTIVRIVVRSGSCYLLQHVRFTRNMLKLLLDTRRRIKSEQNCDVCGFFLTNHSEYQLIGYDCIGVWILNNNNLDECIQLIKVFNLNTPGRFSIRFYQNVEFTMKGKIGTPTTCKVCQDHNLCTRPDREY